MGHAICGVVLGGPYDVELAAAYDLRAAVSDGVRTLLPIDHYWSAAWQAKRGARDGMLDVPAECTGLFPREGCVAAIIAEITGVAVPRFAVIETDYFGGTGQQWAVLYEGARSVGGCVRVNVVLRALGLTARAGLDEWDTFGLASFRDNPEYLDRYRALCDELGV